MIRPFLRMTLLSLSISALAACNDKDSSMTDEVSNALTFYSDWPTIQSAIPKDPTLENQIASILAQMTLEEKVGQMIQPNLDQVTPAEAKQYKLGSLLNGGGSWPNNHKQAPASEWVSKADEYWTALEEAYQDRGFRIPFMWATDAVHGHNNVFGATVFPHNIGLGAANDPDLIYRIGQATAKEVAATGLDWTFAPTVAAPRDYRWGRTYEGYSEDPAIIYSYAGKMVEGLQGGAAGLKTDQHVISNVKHWLGDGGTLKGVDRGVNQYSESYLINLHATGYFSGLNAGAQVVMSSFNSWDNDANYDQTTTGTYNKKIHGSKYLINDVLKQKMGFDGLVVTDWNGQGEVNGCSAANCPAAVNAGNDIFMVTAKIDWKAFYTNVIAQVNDGTIPLSRIDDAVTRILRVKMRAGLWEKPKPSGRSLAGNQTVLGATSHRALAREAVSKSLVLLKNKSNVLPLQPTQKIYLAGSAADNLQKQTGGWSLTWQGTENTLGDFPGATTVKSALTAQIGSENIITDLDAADENTIALIAIGEDPYAEFVGDIKDHQTLGFASLKASYAADLAAIKAAKAKGLKVVTLFFSGRPMYVNEEINHSDAFVAAWLPGTEASGITDVLYAANGADFSGKLSFTWPNTKCSTTINREAPHIPSYVVPEFEQSLHGEHAPLFAYGYGLSYATGAGAADLDNLPLDARNYGCGQSQPDTGIATLPLEIYNRNAGGEFVMRISGANNGWAAIPVSTQVETDQGDVSTRPINYQGQYDAVNVRFDGEGQAQLYLQYADEQGQDQSSYLNAESTLQFDIRMIQQPTKAFTLAQHCVWPCLGQIKMNDHLPAVSTNWSTVKIPLQCFADEGMNFALMNTPLLFLTEGEAAFDLGNVRLVPKSVDPASDAPTCAELKGIVDDADPIDVGTVTDDKALAVGFRTTTATALSITTIGNGLNSASLHTSSNAYEGESSLLLRHTGADWGGIFGDFNPPLDLSAYDTIKIALAAPSALSYLELKFDDATKAALSKNLLSYPFTSDGIWKIYSVPLAEFVGVDMSQIVAMGFWHPKDALGSYLKADILIDDIHFTEAVDTGTVTDEKALAVGFRTSTATALGITGDGIALNSTTLHTSSLAYEGDASLLMRHNGADWGGMFGEFSPPLNLSAYTKIVLAMAAPAELAELQLKFEDTLGGAVEKNLVSYPSTSAGAWKIYSVPLSEFVGVDMSQIKAIGFWHPKKAGGGYLASDILVDDIHFE